MLAVNLLQVFSVIYVILTLSACQIPTCFSNDLCVQVASHLVKMDCEGCKDIDSEYLGVAVDLYLSAPLKHPAKCALAK